jgi:hypothetical protein
VPLYEVEPQRNMINEQIRRLYDLYRMTGNYSAVSCQQCEAFLILHLTFDDVVPA